MKDFPLMDDSWIVGMVHIEFGRTDIPISAGSLSSDTRPTANDNQMMALSRPISFDAYIQKTTPKAPADSDAVDLINVPRRSEESQMTLLQGLRSNSEPPPCSCLIWPGMGLPDKPSRSQCHVWRDTPELDILALIYRKSPLGT